MVDNQDKAIALLGIAATKKPQEELCPPDNVMSAFIENRVNSKTRTMMLSHLNQCEDCYLVWEQLGVYVVEETPHVVKQPQTEKVGLIQQLKNWYGDRSLWVTTVPSFALASLAIVLVFNLSDTSYTDISSAPSIAVAELDANMLADSINQLPIPWENSTFGFSRSNYSTPVKAVGTGLWNTRSTLINSKDPLPEALTSEVTIDWQNSEWRDYYAFGQWTVNAWVLAKAKHVDQSQWAELSKMLQTLEASFKQHPESAVESIIALQAIDKIKVSLDSLSVKEDALAQTTLLRELDLSLQKLFL